MLARPLVRPRFVVALHPRDVLRPYCAGHAGEFVRADVATRPSGRRPARKSALVDVAARAASRSAHAGRKRNGGRAWARCLIRIGEGRATVVAQREQLRIDRLVMGRRPAHGHTSNRRLDDVVVVGRDRSAVVDVRADARGAARYDRVCQRDDVRSSIVDVPAVARRRVLEKRDVDEVLGVGRGIRLEAPSVRARTVAGDGAVEDRGVIVAVEAAPAAGYATGTVDRVAGDRRSRYRHAIVVIYAAAARVVGAAGRQRHGVSGDRRVGHGHRRVVIDTAATLGVCRR